MLHKSRWVIGGLLVVLTSAVVSYAVSAAVPNSLLPQGATRFAVRADTPSGMDSTTSETFVNMPGTSTSITIPAGKTGDVLIWFCGEAVTETWVTVRARVGGAWTKPDQMQLKQSDNAYSDSRCANFYKTGVRAGTHNVLMQWHANGGLSGMGYRSILVLVNIH